MSNIEKQALSISFLHGYSSGAIQAAIEHEKYVLYIIMILPACYGKPKAADINELLSEMNMTAEDLYWIAASGNYPLYLQRKLEEYATRKQGQQESTS